MGRIVEVVSDGRRLSIERGFLIIADPSKKEEPAARLPLDDIDVLLINSHGVTVTSNTFITFAERGVPIVLCDGRHMPVTMALPLSSNYELSKRLREQISMKETTAASLWKAIVAAKISRQSELLKRVGKAYLQLVRLAERVEDGDPNNLEAQAAKHYWSALFGSEFRRSATSAINAKLNYGYAIIRATVARYVCAHGLSPSLGVHHSNASNPMCLVDDLMEPFRPLVDHAVYRLDNLQSELCKRDKEALVSLLAETVTRGSESVVVETLLKDAVFSFYRACSTGSTELEVDWGFSGSP